jgi:glutamine synthetase
VPKSLEAAADNLARSEFACQAFGAEVVEHLVHSFRVEQEAYDSAVTDWERERYFERG